MTIPGPGEPPSPQPVARRLRERQSIVGYWMNLEVPVLAERIGRMGYDYVVCDLQHGLLDYDGMLRHLMAVKAGGRAEPFVRVLRNDAGLIGRALDAGAAGVIVPMVNTPEEAAQAVSAAKYPPAGNRSYGPMRTMLSYAPAEDSDEILGLIDADAATALIVMIETSEGLSNVEAICATPGLDGLYVGPADLSIALGGKYFGDPAARDVTAAAIQRIASAARLAGIAAGIHTFSGSQAAERLAQGYTFVSIASDVDHLTQAAAAHLQVARGVA